MGLFAPLLYCICKKGLFRVVSFPEGSPTTLERALYCGQQKNKTSKVGSSSLRTIKLGSSSWGRTQDWRKERRGSFVQSFFMENSWRLSFYIRDGIGLSMKEERISMMQFMENSCRWFYYLGRPRTLYERGKDLHSAILLHRELLQVVLLPKRRPRTLYERGADLHSAILLQGQLTT